jgi:hypothetical protein
MWAAVMQVACETRVVSCKEIRKTPPSFYTNTIDLIMDNNCWECPLTVAAKKYTRCVKHVPT